VLTVLLSVAAAAYLAATRATAHTQAVEKGDPQPIPAS
jgi:hypothetical protein